MNNLVPDGFSKFSKEEKLRWLVSCVQNPQESEKLLTSAWHRDAAVQEVLDRISENTVSNFHLPYGIAPNFLVNGKLFQVPMVTEESSVVAAAAAGAKFWATRGGFHARVLSDLKTGQVHFIWIGDKGKLERAFAGFEPALREAAFPVTRNMDARGGGIRAISLVDKTASIPGYYQLFVSFDTRDSMGANFINSCLEAMATELKKLFTQEPGFHGAEKEVEIVMSILSNYNPECLVEAFVECPVEELGQPAYGMNGEDFARKFSLAVQIAEIDIHRATTHNKGIFNGVDAVVLATGNDFRAVEAGGHAWASRSGKYTSLSYVVTEGGKFKLTLCLPLAIGTVGGLTSLHPMAALSLAILGQPGAHALMETMVSCGLANHFSAIRSLVTGGIQKGHMKMHLPNILAALNTDENERARVIEHFRDKTVSYAEVYAFLKTIRK